MRSLFKALGEKKYILEVEEVYIPFPFPFPFLFLFHEQAEEEVKLHVAEQDLEANDYTGEANPDNQ